MALSSFVKYLVAVNAGKYNFIFNYSRQIRQTNSTFWFRILVQGAGTGRTGDVGKRIATAVLRTASLTHYSARKELAHINETTDEDCNYCINSIAELLVPVLEEEKETDAILTSTAEPGINNEASEEPLSTPS